MNMNKKSATIFFSACMDKLYPKAISLYSRVIFIVKHLLSGFTQWAVGPYGQSDESLGIYYNEKRLTAVHVKKQGKSFQVASLDTINLPESESIADGEESEQSQVSSLAHALETLNANPDIREKKRLSTHLALDAGLYNMQHHHSDFKDSTQINQTLRFDIEEEALLDSESVFLCYKKLPTQGPGQDSIVFSVARDEMRRLTTCFEQNELDCLSVEPNGVAWMHFLECQESLPLNEPALVLGRTGKNLYFLITDRQHQLVLFRSYYYSDESDTMGGLMSELRRCLAGVPQDQQPKKLWMHRDGFYDDHISQFNDNLSLSVHLLAETDIDRAFAAGAGLGWFYKNEEEDFRNDGLVPATFEQVKKKAWLGLSAATTLLLIFLVFVMHLHHRQYQATIEFAEEAILSTWELTYPGRKLPKSKSRIPSTLAGALNQLKINNQNQSSQDLAGSSSHTFYLLMGALDSLPVKFDLVIDKLRVGKNSVDLSGTVPNTQDQISLDEAFQANGRFIIDKWNFVESSSNRRSFSMSLRINNPSKTESKRRSRKY
jgi:hypothetical protein